MQLPDYIREAARKTPDPSRALKNLETFLQEHPQLEQEIEGHIYPISQLFAYSQFLANFSVKNPEALFHAIQHIKIFESREDIENTLSTMVKGADYTRALMLFRVFKRQEMIKITLRDIMKISSPVESMEQMSDLADAIIECACAFVKNSLVQKYGMPHEDSFAVVGLGKLGARELNYSSDVDLIFVYGPEKGQTGGILGPTGSTINVIDTHEFYCKLATDMSRFLSQNTEDGFVYRVDMRLRPDGQRGEAALSLGNYELYYESWGREWERIALIRARHIAGDKRLSDELMDMIRPFVWRKYLDFSTIEEIRGLKAKIDATFKRDDIKRGYGGIREIEFFAQAFQLIYGGRELLLRQRSTLIALHMLWQKNLIGDEDAALLSDNYIYLRKIEHSIQMLNDIQTHVLPLERDQREALARKMGFPSFDEFSKDLQARRQKVRDIYDLFFGKTSKEETRAESFIFREAEEEEEIRSYLTAKGIPEVEESLLLINKIKEGIAAFNTLKGRRILNAIMPALVETAITSPSATRALKNLVHFMEMFSQNEAYLELFKENRNLTNGLIQVFSQSDYLSRLILSNPAYLDMLTGGMAKRKALSRMKRELSETVQIQQSLNTALRVFKKAEEIRLGLLFMNRVIGIHSLLNGLSQVAEAIADYTIREISSGFALPPHDAVCITAMGKFGGREITINSDLDILFFVSDEVREDHVKAAEKFLKALQLYTKDGIAYKVDTRLRPDGTKGPLLNNIEGYRNYYLKNADRWEIQALIKARPVSGSRESVCSFMKMRDGVFEKRASDVTAEDMVKMRRRIMTELVKPEGGIDIKLHRGGIEEIEFLVQYLQLRSVSKARVFYQDTLSALRALVRGGILSEEAGPLAEAYCFYRTVESYLRLSLMSTIKETDPEAKYLAVFMGFKDVSSFADKIRKTMTEISEIVGKLYEI